MHFALFKKKLCSGLLYVSFHCAKAKGLLGGLKPKLPILLYCTRCQTPLASEVNFLLEPRLCSLLKGEGSCRSHSPPYHRGKQQVRLKARVDSVAPPSHAMPGSSQSKAITGGGTTTMCASPTEKSRGEGKRLNQVHSHPLAHQQQRVGIGCRAAVMIF